MKRREQLRALAEVWEDCGKLDGMEFAKEYGWTKREQKAFAYGLGLAAEVMTSPKVPFGLLCGVSMDYLRSRKAGTESAEAFKAMFGGDPVAELSSIFEEVFGNGTE